MAHGAEAAGGPPGIPAVGGDAEVGGQPREPRLPERRIDELEQRPYRALGEPRIGVGIEARRGRHRLPDHRARRGELDVRAHAVRAAGARAEARGHPLGEPALHAPGGDGDELGRERVRRRLGEQHGEGVDEAVGPFGSVDVQHGVQVSRSAARPGGRTGSPLWSPDGTLR
jgi:hypothetical protein